MPDDPWQAVAALRQDICELRGQLHTAMIRIIALEADTPQARQLQLEADLAMADLAESGYDHHGRDCQCSYCCYDPAEGDDYEPGPACGDQSAMSEYSYRLPAEEPGQP
jgi:hypothetical protein